MKIVITGASSGIGFETAIELAADPGNTVVALARSAEKLEKLADAVRHRNLKSVIYTIPFDIVTGNYKKVLLPFLVKNLETIDILINNAGALVQRSFDDLDTIDFLSMLQSNFLGHVNMIQHLLPMLKVNGGHIVNIGSMGGFQGSVKFPGLSAYSASKAAFHSLTECLALELAESNIKVNCLALGSAQTEMLEKAFPGYQSPVSATDMGKFVAQFSLTGNRFFNGKILPVSGTTP